MYSNNTDMRLAYLESEKGNVLSGTAETDVYGTKKAIDGSVVLANQTLAQIGADCASVDPSIVEATQAPVDLVAPEITGSHTAAGQVLSCSTGTWGSKVFGAALAYTRQWKNDTVNIAGATAATYTLVAGDIGHSITCLVTATDAAGDAATHLSNAVACGVAPVNTVAPAVTGTTVVGSTLTCSAGTWTGTATITHTYQWQRDTVNIAGATAATRVLAAADAPHSLRCVVTGTNNVSTVSANSNAVSVTAT